MSSGISNKVKSTGHPKSTGRAAGEAGLQPWQFFLLAGLGCATAAVFVTRGQGLTALVLSTILIGVTTLAGFAALRTLRPLVFPDEERTPMVGRRTRAALEREKTLVLRALKDLEFDRAMGKLSESDWRDMSGRLRARAGGLMRQLDAGAGYRAQIERDLAGRLERAGIPLYAQGGAAPSPGASGPAVTDMTISAALTAEGAPPEAAAPAAAARRSCEACGAANEADARFCKSCGRQL